MSRLIILIFFLCASALSSENPNKIELINDGQSAVFDCRWESADSIFTGLKIIDNADPARYLYRAAALQAEMTDKEENLHGDKFQILCDSAKTAAEARLNYCTRRDSALCYLYIGHQYTYRALWESRFRSKFSALKLGRKAHSAYRNGIETDSTLYDLYLGLGSYHYWKSTKSGLLRSLGLFKDEREKGIDEIELAADSSLFSEDAAVSALIWIVMNEKKYDSAAALSSRLNDKYPNGNTFKWPLAETWFKSGGYKKAAQIYDSLFYRLETEPGNYYNIIECLEKLYRCYDKLDDSTGKRETFSRLNALYINIPKEIKGKQKKKLQYLLNEERNIN